jgi:hypothetical protein
MGHCGNPFGGAQRAYARRCVDRRPPSHRSDDRAVLVRARLGLALLLIFAAVGMLIAAPRAQAQTAPCADLVIDAVGVTPTAPVLGQPSTINVTVRNAGTCAAGTFTVSWRPSLFAPTGASTSVSGLAPGTSTVVNLPHVFTQLGLALTFASVDPTSTVSETNELNNTFFRFVSVPPAVDLVVTDLTVNPQIPLAGQQTTVSITVVNQGSVAAGPFRVDFTPALLAAGIPRQVTGLAAGASTTLTLPYTWTNAGFFDTSATVDAGGAIAESDESNNSSLLRVMSVPNLPDLVITDAVVSPSQVFSGTSVTATITVKNQGFTNAGNFAVRWQPWLLGTPVSTQVNGLSPGASATVSLSSVFSATGIFIGAAGADPLNSVAEIDEGNNSHATNVTVSLASLIPEKTATGGFGDWQNSYAWSMAWFKGKLYVGTARREACVEYATLDFFFPGQGYYNGPLDFLPEANCPPDYYDLDLRAEIWQYTPETEVWRRVFQSSTIPNPRAPGKQVARDIGFRGMVVHTNASGEQALYVGGVTTDEYIPELAVDYPPRILRSVDGETFAPLPTGPGVIHNTFGEQRPIGFRALLSFQGRLFASASGGLTGDGVLFEIRDPEGPSPQFVQVTPDTIHIYELAAFNGTIYLGTGTPDHGYSVFRVTDLTTTPFGVTQVLPEGAGRGIGITSVVSMHVFKGRLYVGANGWGAGSSAAAEEVRINPDDSWDVVAGAPRTVDGVTKTSISGLGDGFGNFFNAHMWRAETHNGALYIGTNDASSAFRTVPGLAQVLEVERGFDVWGTCDGQYWWQVTRNAFGDGMWNFGARSIVSTPFGLFVGSTNHIEGTSVWLGNASPCGSSEGQFGRNRGTNVTVTGAAKTATGAAALPSPTRLVTEAQPCGTGLSWDRSPGATRYRILRAEYRSANVSVDLTRAIAAQLGPDMPAPVRSSNRGTGGDQRVSVAGPYVAIGTTTGNSFVDRNAKPGGRYNYQVVAEGRSRKRSSPSNVAAVPSPTAASTFAQLNAALQRVGATADAGSTTKLLRLGAAVRVSWQRADRSGALPALAQLRRAVDATRADVRGAAGLAAASDAENVIFELERRAALDAACKR